MPRLTKKEERTREFVGLCRRHRLALSQSQTAFENGHPKIADGVLRQAEAIQVRIEQHVRAELCNALTKKRGQIGQRLHLALANGQTASARQLGEELAGLDRQIEAA